MPRCQGLRRHLSRIRKQEIVGVFRTWDLPGWGSSEAGGTQRPRAEMDLAKDLEKELETTAQEVLGKLRSGELFQSNWDTAAFIIFLIFLGTVLLLLLLVCLHCCCHSCCSRRASRPRKEHRRGVDNLALEP